MRIDDLNRAPGTENAEKAGQTSSSQQRPAEKGSVAAGSDQVEVSQAAQALAPPDPGRIEQLRLQVQSGSYDVPAQAVANALIDAHLTE
jgi:flagellar biosynthesis anti-sigma factor FlgM